MCYRNTKRRLHKSMTALATIVLVTLSCQMRSSCLAAGDGQAKPATQICLDSGHHWRPPFGLERIGRPLVAVVESGRAIRDHIHCSGDTLKSVMSNLIGATIDGVRVEAIADDRGSTQYQAVRLGEQEAINETW